MARSLLPALALAAAISWISAAEAAASSPPRELIFADIGLAGTIDGDADPTKSPAFSMQLGWAHQLGRQGGVGLGVHFSASEDADRLGLTARATLGSVKHRHADICAGPVVWDDRGFGAQGALVQLSVWPIPVVGAFLRMDAGQVEEAIPSRSYESPREAYVVRGIHDDGVTYYVGLLVGGAAGPRGR